jgi:hypothetical protein
MVEKTTNLDDHRGLMAQRATELRRLRAEVEADQSALRARQQELETLLAAAPASYGRSSSRLISLISVAFILRSHGIVLSSFIQRLQHISSEVSASRGQFRFRNALFLCGLSTGFREPLAFVQLSRR